MIPVNVPDVGTISTVNQAKISKIVSGNIVVFVDETQGRNCLTVTTPGRVTVIVMPVIF